MRAGLARSTGDLRILPTLEADAIAHEANLSATPLPSSTTDELDGVEEDDVVETRMLARPAESPPARRALRYDASEGGDEDAEEVDVEEVDDDEEDDVDGDDDGEVAAEGPVTAATEDDDLAAPAHTADEDGGDLPPFPAVGRPTATSL